MYVVARSGDPLRIDTATWETIAKPHLHLPHAPLARSKLTDVRRLRAIPSQTEQLRRVRHTYNPLNFLLQVWRSGSVSVSRRRNHEVHVFARSSSKTSKPLRRQLLWVFFLCFCGGVSPISQLRHIHIFRNAGHSSFLQPCAQAMPAGGSSRCRHLVPLCKANVQYLKPMVTNTSLTRPADTTLPESMSESPSTTEPRTPR